MGEALDMAFEESQVVELAANVGLRAVGARLLRLELKAVDSTQKTAVARARVLLADLRIALSAATLLVEPQGEDDDE